MAYTIERLPGSSVWVVRGQGEGHVGEAAEGRYIGQRYGDIGSAYGFRMAYLAPPGAQYGIARTVEILSGSRGVEARVFTEEAEAMRWVQESRVPSAEAGGR